MGRSFSRKNSGGSFPPVDDAYGTFPILSKGDSRPTSTTITSSGSPAKMASKLSKMACAIGAFKCSSRAMEEDNYHGTIPTVDHASENDSGDMDEWQADFAMNEPLSPKESVIGNKLSNKKPKNQEKREFSLSDHQRNRKESDGSHGNAPSADASIVSDGSETSNRLLELTGAELIDHAPFEDLDAEEEGDIDHLLPRRIPSEDTHDTPNTSNRDPGKPALDLLAVGTEPDSGFDAFCQTHFSTPKVIHSKTSLGDSITPLGSPVTDGHNEDETDSKGSQSHPPGHSSASRLLQMPTMYVKQLPVAYKATLSEVSSGTSLFGESISDEKKVADEEFLGADVLTLDPDKAIMKIGQQEVRARTGHDRSHPQSPPIRVSGPPHDGPSHDPSLSSRTQNGLSSTEDSSLSSVSSFAEISTQRSCGRQSDRALTPHPFFWRSHPAVTVRSCDFRHPQVLIRNVSPGTRLPRVHTLDDADFHLLSERTPMSSIGRDKNCRCSDQYSGSYLHPQAVQKMWNDSNTFGLQVNTNWKVGTNSNRHPHGPPSARSGAILQSLTSFATNRLGFTRSESSRLNNHSAQ